MKKVSGQGLFLAYFIANIGSYSQLKTVSFFPNSQENIANKVTRLKNLIKMFKTCATSQVQCLND